MQRLAATTLAALRAIAEEGPLTIRELDELESMSESRPVRGYKNTMQSLTTHGLVDGEKMQGRGTLFTINHKGMRLLGTISALPIDTPVALPRTRITTGDYDGSELRPFVGRANSLDAYDLPSLDGGARIARSRPISLGAPMEVRR